MEKKRIDYVDVAKGIGILLVVIGHSITNAPKSIDSTYSIPLAFITQFHMPLFFSLSGIVFSEKYVQTPLKSSLKKFRSIYIPFIVYNLIFVLLHNFLKKLYFFEDEYGVVEFRNEIISVLSFHVKDICGAMWFLRPLLFIIIFFIWCRFLISKLLPRWPMEIVFGIIVLLGAIFGISGKCPTTFNVDAGLYYLPFFYLGFLYKKYGWNEFIRKRKRLLFPISFVIEILIVSIYPVGLSGRNTIRFYWLFCISALAGCIMVFSFSQFKYIEKSRLLKMLGQYSLDIMALHFVFFKPTSFLIMKYYGLGKEVISERPVVFGIAKMWWIPYTVISIFLSVVSRKAFDFVKRKIRSILIKEKSKT